MALQFSVAKLTIPALVALVIVFMIIVSLKPVHRSSAPTRQVLKTPTSGPTIEEFSKGDKKSMIDIMLERLVIVAGLSSSRYKVAMAGMIGSLQRMMPTTKIIVYDLGLTVEERDNVSRFCGVELRTFNFTKYPDHVSPRILTNYAWKPILIAELSRELSKEYEVIMWADASVRLLAPLQKYVLPYFLDVDLPFVGTQESHFIVQLTHDGTLQYLNVTRESMRGIPTIQGGCLVFRLTEKIKGLLKSWEDCALHRECIAPEGATLKGCNWQAAYGNYRYSECHRFDQSALDVILFRDFGKEVWKTALWNGNYKWTQTFAIDRSTKQEYPAAYCT